MMFTRSDPHAVRCQTSNARSEYLPSVKGMHFVASGLATEFLLTLTYLQAAVFLSSGDAIYRCAGLQIVGTCVRRKKRNNENERVLRKPKINEIKPRQNALMKIRHGRVPYSKTRKYASSEPAEMTRVTWRSSTPQHFNPSTPCLLRWSFWTQLFLCMDIQIFEQTEIYLCERKKSGHP